MRVTLISLDQELYCVGLRILSSCLKLNNHDVQVIFMPTSGTGEKNQKFRVKYPDVLLQQLGSLCSDSDLIGISLMTNHFVQAAAVTDFLKLECVNTPVIWGGIHPTVEPEVCLEHADVVCLGEGEKTLVELAERMEQKRPFLDVENLWFKANGDIVRNSLRPLEQNLDEIPFPDYTFQDHFISVKDRFEQLTPEKLSGFKGERFRKQSNGIVYPVLTSRGCPFACTYCCNSVYHRLYPHERHLRWRSAENVVQELLMIQRMIAPIACVVMVDDNFTARPDDRLRDFCELYKCEIGLPFFAQVSPLTITRQKMRLLLDAGCIKVVMGVETANQRIADVYDRGKSHAAVPGAISIIEESRSRMPLPPSYQFIIDNPYETIEETVETLKFAVSLPRPWDNPVYSLMLFPGTPLYERASSDGLIKNKHEEVYSKNWLDQSRPFFQFWIKGYRTNMPPLLMRLMLARVIVRLLNSRFADRLWRRRIFRWLWKGAVR